MEHSDNAYNVSMCSRVPTVVKIIITNKFQLSRSVIAVERWRFRRE